MEYEVFERDFITRTLAIIQQYETHVQSAVEKREQVEVTLLINCLLGLLVLPNERRFNRLPPIPIEQLGDWGFHLEFVKNWGKRPEKVKPEHYGTLCELIYRMRNSISHLDIRPHGDGSEITKIEFYGDDGFSVLVPQDCLKQFVTKLAQAVAH
ncbi:MAG: HEPN family nuclease [Verrucomicrobiia bacterium]|jgi:hypothetical protein